MKTLAEMNKAELRAVCKEAGVKNYGSMTKDQMIEAVLPKAGLVEVAKTEQAAPEVEPLENVVGVEQGEEEEPEVISRPSILMGFSQLQTALDNKVDSGRKIEKNRDIQNGLSRPSKGGKCRAVWDMLDGKLAELGEVSLKVVKAVAAEKGWNANNATIEYYQWKKFNGITKAKK